MSSGKMLLGVLAGVAAGALIGVLFAPEKGAVTRKRMAKKGDDYVDDLKEKFNDFLEGVKKDVETVKDNSNEFMENGAAKVDHLKMN
jgi:gas vesicle protein